MFMYLLSILGPHNEVLTENETRLAPSHMGGVVLMKSQSLGIKRFHNKHHSHRNDSSKT